MLGKMKKIKSIKGITLVALVITIILLLILAGITITQLTRNGLFGNAKVSREITRYKTAKEIVELKLMEIEAECIKKEDDYTLVRIAEQMKVTTNITIEKYYNKKTSKIQTGISENLIDLEGIVVSVDEYSEYKFLIGEEAKIQRVLEGKVTNTTTKEDFTDIELFEKNIFNGSNTTIDKKPLPLISMIDNNGIIHDVDNEIINSNGNEMKKDVDGREYIHFDGTNYIETEEISELAGDTEKTIMLLVRTNNESQQTYINLGTESNGGKLIALGSTYGYLRFYSDWWTAPYDARKDFMSDNEWHFICVSYDKTKISLYLEGKEIFSTNIAIKTVNPKLIIAAWDTNRSDPFIGDISDVRIYNRCLNSEEIKTVYEDIKK